MGKVSTNSVNTQMIAKWSGETHNPKKKQTNKERNIYKKKRNELRQLFDGNGWRHHDFPSCVKTFSLHSKSEYIQKKRKENTQHANEKGGRCDASLAVRNQDTVIISNDPGRTNSSIQSRNDEKYIDFNSHFYIKHAALANVN